MIHDEWLTVDRHGDTARWPSLDEAVGYLTRRVRYGLAEPDQEYLRYRTVSDWYDVRVVDKTQESV